MSIEQPISTQTIAGFWRRFGAFFIDCLLLGIVGMVIGLVFVDDLVAIGVWGRLLGFVIALIYFGILNSKIGNGQTLGKRLLKIKVVGRDGTPLSLLKSLLRFLPLGLPWFLNKAQFPTATLSAPLSLLLMVVIFGLGFSLIYLYLFNRRTRQSLHDLLVGSYVVTAQSTGEVSASPIWRPHLLVCALFILSTSSLQFFVPDLAESESFSSFLRAYHAVTAEPGVINAKLNKDTLSSGRGKTTSVNLFAFLDAPDINNEQLARRLATIVLETDTSTMNVDAVRVTLVYGYDIGIASSWRSHNFSRTPAEWNAEIVD